MPLVVVQTVKQLREVESFLMESPKLGFDVECTDLAWDRLKLVGAGFSDGDTHVYIPMGHENQPTDPQRLLLTSEADDAPPEPVMNCPFDEAIDVIRAVAQRREEELLMVCHNWKYEIGVLREYGIEPNCKVADTMLAHWLLAGRGHNGLAEVSNKFLKRGRSDAKFEDLVAPYGGRIEYVPIHDAARYCAREDAGDTFDLWDRHLERLLEEWGLTKVFWSLEMEMPAIIQRMERRGVLWDLQFLRDSEKTMLKEVEEIDEALFELVGSRFNPGSNDQLSRIMFNEKEWWDPNYSEVGKKTDKNGRPILSTKAEVVEMQWKAALTEEGKNAALLVLRRRKLEKLISTYTGKLVDFAMRHEDARVHANFNQHGTDTGRFSSSQPNLQQIPRPQDDQDPKPWLRGLPPLRSAVIAPPEWVLIGVDYSQIELRVMAHESRDPRLTEAYQNGEDIHAITGAEIGCSRQEGKVINFALIYRMTPYSLASHIGVPLPVAERYHRGYFSTYRGVATYHDRVLKQAERDGFVRTITGRFREIPNINIRTDTTEAQRKKAAAWRMAINTRIQGSAADIIKIAMRNIVRKLKAMGLYPFHAHFIMQVHDELVMEVRREVAEQVAEVVKHEMEYAVPLRVPLKAGPKIGRSWLEVK